MMDRTIMLVGVWAIIVPIILLVLIAPSFSSGVSIFKPHYVIRFDATVHRTFWLGKVDIDSVDVSVSNTYFSLIPHGFVTLPWGGKGYDIIVYDKTANKMDSKMIKLKHGQTSQVTLIIKTDVPGEHDYDIRILDASTGKLLKEIQNKVMVS